MAVTSTRTTSIAFSGDIAAQISLAAVNNTNSPGDVDILTLTTGANTITLPSGGSAPKGATIIPPPANAVLVTLKGVSGDTGIPLHLTDPAIVTFDTTATTFVLTAAAQVVGLRIVWT